MVITEQIKEFVTLFLCIYDRKQNNPGLLQDT